MKNLFYILFSLFLFSCGLPKRTYVGYDVTYFGEVFLEQDSTYTELTVKQRKLQITFEDGSVSELKIDKYGKTDSTLVLYTNNIFVTILKNNDSYDFVFLGESYKTNNCFTITNCHLK